MGVTMLPSLIVVFLLKRIQNWKKHSGWSVLALFKLVKLHHSSQWLTDVMTCKRQVWVSNNARLKCLSLEMSVMC